VDREFACGRVSGGSESGVSGHGDCIVRV